MVQQIDDHAMACSEHLASLEGYVMPQGRSLADDCAFELKKLRYRVRDFRDVVDIAEGDFESGSSSKVTVASCLREI